MTLQSSGRISVGDIQTEFGGDNPAAMSEYYRGGLYVTENNTWIPVSGQLKESDFYNAQKQYKITLTTNYSTPQNLRTLALSLGWNGSDALLVTNNGVISSNSATTPALTISGSFPYGVLLVNNGYIVGMGGQGASPETVGQAGGTALSASVAVTVTNNGTIAGGGGGGGAGTSWGWNGLVRSCSGSGGAGGLTQTPGTANYYGFPSSNPSYDSNADGLYDKGGAYYVWGYGGRVSSPGGKGGDWGQAGDAGGTVDGAYNYSGYAGGVAGKSVVGNSNITWIATGTRIGPVT